MNSETILSNVSKHITLTSEEVDCFTSFLKSHILKRKEILLLQGNTCKCIYFVNSGTLRAFALDEEGKETTVMFGFKDWWITDMYSFAKETKSLVSIEALEQSEVLELQKNGLETLYQKIPKFERLFRILMQNAYVREQLRVMENLTLPAKQRYENFLSKYPTLINCLTQKQMASYLGITPEFLSMLKSNKNKGR